MRYGKKIEQARILYHQKQDNKGAVRTLASALPEDLIVKSNGPLAERRKDGVQYGCDVTKLPVPPPSTLEPYAIPPEPVTNK